MGSNIFIAKGSWDIPIPATLCSRHMGHSSRSLRAESGRPTERLPGVGVRKLQIGDESRQSCCNCELCEMETGDSEHMPGAMTKQLLFE